MKKINGILETFDRMIINGYSLKLCNYRHFLFYLIQNSIKLKEFDKFALEQTNILCNNIDNYISTNNCECIYLNSGKINKNEEKIIEHKAIETVKELVPMGKSISNLYRYVEISKSITKRYIKALHDINTDEVPLTEIEKISDSIITNDRKYTGFNILEKDTLNLFSIISSEEYLINGFINKNIRKNYFKEEITNKEINKLTRILSKLKAHRIIKKVARKINII